jgi:hypothetical protein
LINKYRKKPTKQTKIRMIVSQYEVDKIDVARMIDVYVDTFMFEPANTDHKYAIRATYQYIHYPPEENLHPYITDFGMHPMSSDEVDCCVDLCCCVGHGRGSHHFFRAEGVVVCSYCSKSICLECTFQNQGEDNRYFCFDCYLPMKNMTERQMQEEKTSDELRGLLREMGVDSKASDHHCDLQDIYDARVSNPIYGKTTINQITAPLENSDYLQNFNEGDDSVKSTFKFETGGHFVVDEDIDNATKIGLLEILSELVKVYKKIQKHTPIRLTHYYQTSF